MASYTPLPAPVPGQSGVSNLQHHIQRRASQATSTVSTFAKQRPKTLVALVASFCVVFLLGATASEPIGRPLRDLHQAIKQHPYYPSKYLGYTKDDYDAVPALGPQSSSDLARAVKRSEDLWSRNVAKREDFVAQTGGYDTMKMFSTKGSGQFQSFSLWDVFVPAFPCPWEVERIGRMADGGKYTCGLPRIRQKRGDRCVIYSFGVERESSWEAELLERTDCEIWMYDFSVDKFGPQLEAMDPEISKRAHFFSYGIGGKDEVVDGHEFFTLRTLMKRNGHDWIDILKVDVEGAEFKILPEVVEDFGEGRLPFGQLLLEIHADHTEHAFATGEFASWWKGLEKAGLRAFASELNYPSISWLAYPTAIEIGFLNNCNGNRKCGSLLRDG